MKDGSTFPRKVLNDDEKYARMDMPVTRKQGLKLLVADNSLNALEEVDDDPLSVEEYRVSYYGNIDLPQSLYKMGNIVTELKDIAFSLKPQMMMRNTCDSRRWFTSRTDAVSDATNVESNAFSTNAAGNAFSTNVSGNAIHGEGPGILHRMVRAIYIKEGNFPNIDNFIASSVSFINEGNFKSIHNCIPNLVVLGAPWYLLSVDWYVSCWKSYCKKDFSPTKCLLNYLENWNVTLLTMTRIARIGPIVQTFLRVGS
ncbi:uncharacterized protein LOC132280195 [Cornus florida]|uniref:uncharacterized protein LOC132280195 n=1 Tax=Cornus florida TaxID=4283 RepID=UPI0028A10E75|nr:uncharacterized protein LOC132280195 [Cornus florida]